MTATPAGIAGLDRIAQVKLPVTNLARSVTWYRRLLDLRLWTEFVEDGVLRGAGLIDPQGRFNIALRDRAACASQPNLDGFDVVAFLPASRSVLEDIAARCDRLGIAHSGIYDTPAGPRLDAPDPDGTVVRFYYYTGPTDQFTGLEMHDGQVVGTYHTPRLLPTAVPSRPRRASGTRPDPALERQGHRAGSL
jgi:catechol 2,3-dioxygenase-like lactoylglutathione lyase family enzyme